MQLWRQRLNCGQGLCTDKIPGVRSGTNAVLQAPGRAFDPISTGLGWQTPNVCGGLFRASIYWLALFVCACFVAINWPGPAQATGGAAESTPTPTPNPTQVAPRTAFAVTPVVRYYHHDATGSLVTVTDSSAQVVWRAEMQPFGLGESTSSDHALRFVDQPLASDVGAAEGFYHLGARTYDPLTGRFLSADPLPLTAVKRENPQRFNPYSYALNNPYRYQDASGLQAVSWEEHQARIALRNFINFVEAKLGPNPSLSDRASLFSYGPLIPPDAVINTNNQPIRNRAGQEVDLDWGARLAGLAVAEVINPFTFFDPAALARQAKKEARTLYNPAKDFWNAVDWVGQKFGGERQTGPRLANDPNILGVDLLIDYIVYGGDLRDYFDPVQVPPRPAQP